MESIEKIMSRQEELDKELKPWLEHDSNGLGWVMLKHPLVFSIPYIESMNSMYNAQLKAKKEYAEKALKNKNWSYYLYIHERPYRFQKFLAIEKLMNDKEYWENLASILSDSENIWEYKNIINILLTANRGNKKFFMDEEERKFLNDLPEQFIIYRGHQGVNRNGYNWTISYWHACWFAQRFNKKRSGVVQAIVNKKDIIGILLRRKEYEVVTLPDRLKIQSCRKVVKRPIWIESVLREALARFYSTQTRSVHGLWHWQKVEKNALFFSKKNTWSRQNYCPIIFFNS